MDANDSPLSTTFGYFVLFQLMFWFSKFILQPETFDILIEIKTYMDEQLVEFNILFLPYLTNKDVSAGSFIFSFWSLDMIMVFI